MIQWYDINIETLHHLKNIAVPGKGVNRIFHFNKIQTKVDFLRRHDETI